LASCFHLSGQGRMLEQWTLYAMRSEGAINGKRSVWMLLRAVACVGRY
jgi:hypothetical protein